MCPEESLLSAYFDGEIDPQYLSLINDHIGTCALCTGKLEAYARMKEFMHSEDSIPDAEGAKERVWDSLQSKKETGSDLLHRRVSIPLPFAAAAVFVFFFSTGVLAASLLMRPASTVVVQKDNSTIQLTQNQLEEILSLLSEKDSQQGSVTTAAHEEFVFELGESVSYTESEFKRSLNP